MAVDEGKIGTDGLHEQIVSAVNGLLAQAEGGVLHDGAHTGGGEHAAQAGAAGADHLRQSALGNQIHGQGLVHHALSAHVGGHAHVGGDDVLDLMVVHQLGHAVEFLAVGAGGHAAVVADDGQVLGALLSQSFDDVMGAAAAQEAAVHDGRPVGDHVHSLRNRNNLIAHSVTLLVQIRVGCSRYSWEEGRSAALPPA